MNERLFWDGWQGPARVALFGVLAYLFLILILRVSGKRTLSKMNAFDFIITVASGSTFATVLLNEKVTLAEGYTAFFMLVFMQFAVTWVSVRSQAVRSLIKSVPTVVVWRGEMLPDVMKKERVSESEILASLRESGLSSVGDAHAVVLETEGDLTVLQDGAETGESSTLASLSSHPSQFE